MDERRQPDGESDPGHAELSAWRVNGAHYAAGTQTDQRWSNAGSALEPSAEPLALLGAGPGGEARHRQPYVPGLDDDTPPSGMPVAEPPLWREASRHAPRPADRPDPRLEEYASTPVADPLAAGAGSPPPTAESGLPQRVPAEPDVPVTGEPDPQAESPAEPATARERWTAPELAWIADQLRRDDVPGEAPTGGFDVDAVVAAVREVPGVEAASVRTNPTGMHTLRLDLADDADPGQVSRIVARLLLERMGLAAAPQDVPQARSSQEPAAMPGSAAAPGRTETEGVAREPELPPPPAIPPPAARPVVPVQSRAPQDDWVYEGLDDLLAPDSEPAPEPVPEPVSRPLAAANPGLRVVIDQVQVRTLGLEAAVEVLLTAGDRQATGMAQGPAVDSYLVRLAAVAAAQAIDSLLRGVADPAGPSRCFVEHTGVVPFGNTEVAVVVLLLVCGGWVEQLTGSALVDGDPRQAMVRATLGAVNRRLEALLD